MTTSKRIHYFVREEGANHSYAPEGWSGFYKRLALRNNGKLIGKVYGPAQAMAHIRELRQSIYNGKKIRLNLTFEVVRVITIESTVKILLPVS